MYFINFAIEFWLVARAAGKVVVLNEVALGLDY